MGTLKSLALSILTCVVCTAGAAQAQQPALRFKPLAPCRIADTRDPNYGPFFGPPAIAAGGVGRSFVIPNSPCLAGVPATVAAYSLNVAVVPAANPPFLGFLTIWPTGQPKPLVATLNSYDGRIKANAAIVPAGTGGAISVYVTDITHVILDINGYFLPANDPSAPLAFFPLPPCRVVDTRDPSGPLGGPTLSAQQARSFPILSSSCIPPNSNAQAYSLNFTAVPGGRSLGFLTTWPTNGTAPPTVSTLNALTGTVTANAAIVPAGNGGEISVYALNETHLVIDINGYFAPSTSGMSFYTVAPCRILDTRPDAFLGPSSRDMTASPCGIPPSAQAVVLNATVVPGEPFFGNLILWPEGQTRPEVSTLSAWDGMVTNNMAIVPTNSSGVIDAFATNWTQLILDTSGYFLSGTGPPPTMYTLTVVPSGYGAGTITSLDGKFNCGAVCAVSYLSGTTVTLTPAAAAGSSFAGWSGGGCSGTGSCTIAVNSAQSVAAIFSNNSLTGNWEFNTASTVVPGVTSEVQGSIVQTGTTISGVLHVLASSCFDALTNMAVTGTISGTFVTIASAAVAGQVVTFSGNATTTTLNGTYSIAGGCASGDRGTVSGFKVPSVSGSWTGSFLSSLGRSTNVTAFLTQGSAFADGSFAVSGTVAFQGSPCFASGTLTPGAITSPTGSSVIGTFLWAEINTSNSIVVFEGFPDQFGNQIPGYYFVVGGSCDGDTGTGTLNKM